MVKNLKKMLKINFAHKCSILFGLSCLKVDIGIPPNDLKECNNCLFVGEEFQVGFLENIASSWTPPKQRIIPYWKLFHIVGLSDFFRFMLMQVLFQKVIMFLKYFQLTWSTVHSWL